jgi:hypothetical protein
VAVAVAAAHAAAALGAAVGLPPLAAGIAAAGLALSAAHQLRVVLHRAGSAVVAVEFAEDGRFAVAGPDGAWREARVIAAAVPASWLAVFVARDAARATRAAVVAGGSVDPEAFRRLRVWLRWGLPTAARPAGQ